VASGVESKRMISGKKCVILLGGEIVATPRLIEQCADALVLAADSGVRHAQPLGLAVDCWLGDFDSTTPALARKFKHLPRVVFPRDKDKTDGELAIEEAIRRGCNSFILVGAFGGPRTDHALLHGFQAVELRKRGYGVLMASGAEEASPVLAGTEVFDLEPGALFSLIGFGPLGLVTITGAKWPLENRHVAAGSSLTMSNLATGPVTVSIGKGEGLFIAGSSSGQ
jgi:thiamine pyrophosphokinase